MGIINEIIGYPLGWVMWFFYTIFNNYALAIIFFTIVTKGLLFFNSAKTHRSTIYTSAVVQPKLDKLRKKYGNNKQKMQEEQMRIYAEEGVNPMGSCLPMLIQFPILFGIFDVVYRPLYHILRFSKDEIKAVTEFMKNISGYVIPSGFDQRPEIYVVQAIKDESTGVAQALLDGATGDNKFAEIVEGVQEFSNTLLGGDMGFIPKNLFGTDAPFEFWMAVFMAIPVLSGVFQVLISLYTSHAQKQRGTNSQMNDNPMMKNMKVMMIGMSFFSVWLGYNYPMAVGFYWTISAVTAFIQQLLLNKIYTPERVIALHEKEKLRKKKKNKRPSMMEKYQQMLNEQQAAQGIPVKANSVTDDFENEDGKLSKSKQKEYENYVIREARRKQAEKYGEEYNEE